MPRLLGVDIPNDKSAATSLTYLYGVGHKTASRGSTESVEEER